jgi:hypothetical protein
MPEFLLSVLAVIRVFSQSKRYGSRSPRSPSAGCRAQTQTAATNLEFSGPAVLDDATWLLVPLERRPRDREARHRHRLAPRWFPALLALAFPASRRPAQDHR